MTTDTITKALRLLLSATSDGEIRNARDAVLAKLKKDGRHLTDVRLEAGKIKPANAWDSSPISRTELEQARHEAASLREENEFLREELERLRNWTKKMPRGRTYRR